MTDNSPFSMSTMSDALQHIRFSKGISGSIPPPGFAPRASALSDTRSNAVFNLMTSGEGVAKFKEMISKSDRNELRIMVSLLTSDSDYFMKVVRNKYGSRRVQKLLGISDVDAFFYAAILRRFYDIITNKYASYNNKKSMHPTWRYELQKKSMHPGEVKKHAMYEHVLHHV